MNNFQNPRDANKLTLAPPTANPPNALRRRAELPLASRGTRQLTPRHPPSATFLFDTNEANESTTKTPTHSQQRRKYFLFDTNERLLATSRVATSALNPPARRFAAPAVAVRFAPTHGFSEFQILKVFCMFGFVKSAKQASRSIGPSTMQVMSERLRVHYRPGRTEDDNLAETRAARHPRVYCGSGQTENDVPT
jgi:hypothetical protein